MIPGDDWGQFKSMFAADPRYHVDWSRAAASAKSATGPAPGTVAGQPLLPNQYVPGSPYLNPTQQQDFNDRTAANAGQRIDVNAARQSAQVTHDRLIADLAHNALVSSQHIEESMASRGQYDSGIRDAALTDLRAHTVLSTDRANEDLQTASNLAATKGNALDTAGDALQNWYTVTAGQNASGGSFVVPPSPGVNAPTKPNPQVAPPKPVANAAAKASPPGYTPGKPGQSMPATATTFASGSAPTPHSVWSGTAWSQ